MHADKRQYSIVKNICHGQTENFDIKTVPTNICFYRRLSACIGGL
jgi:hypothetical protein